MFSKEAASSHVSLRDFFKLVKFRVSFSVNHPSYFEPDGLIVFVGPQGSGKTLSAVKYVCNLLKLFKDSILVTNIALKDYPIVTFQDFLKENYRPVLVDEYSSLSDERKKALLCDYYYINRVFPFENADDLIRYSNRQEGVIFLIDEIQLYFNSLESKNINMDVMTQISQQRKQRKHIVCTSQVFGRMAKPLREQFNTVVRCRNYLSCVQVNKFMDNQDVEVDLNSMKINGKVGHVQVFTHSPKDYKAYDTYYIIDRNKFISGEGALNIYESGNV